MTGKRIITLICLLFFFANCQHELYFPEAVSEGTLKSDITGDCLPSKVNGIFTKLTELTSANSIEVTASVTAVGSFEIVSDTINGYSFFAKGKFDQKGLNSVILVSEGKPLEGGTDVFTIKYGNSTCKLAIVVDTPGGGGGGGSGGGITDATYVLGGDPNNCTGFLLSGTYIADYSLNSLTNHVVIDVNVITTGNYTISTPLVNGYKYSASGTFLNTGNQKLHLKGSGTPQIAGSDTFFAMGNGVATKCSFTVLVLPHAKFNFSGAPGNCLPVTVGGIYHVGSALDNSNKVTLQVDVLTTGSYIIATDMQDGFSFFATGSFSTLGIQNLVMQASYTDPFVAGDFTFTPQPNISTCRFKVTVLP